MTKKIKQPIKAENVKKTVGGMQGLANKLLAEKANENTIETAFVAAYAAKGTTDIEFIKARILIYMALAAKFAQKQ